jgi:hypothetical protein
MTAEPLLKISQRESAVLEVGIYQFALAHTLFGTAGSRIQTVSSLLVLHINCGEKIKDGDILTMVKRQRMGRP